MTREEVDLAFWSYHSALCHLGIADIPEFERSMAIKFARDSRKSLLDGFEKREKERELDEQARIVEMYRTGRLVEKLK